MAVQQMEMILVAACNLQEKPGIQLISPTAGGGKKKAGWRQFKSGQSEATGHDNSNTYTQEEDWWTESIAGFDVAVGRPDTLCGWIVGQAALHMETLTEEQVKDFDGEVAVGK